MTPYPKVEDTSWVYELSPGGSPSKSPATPTSSELTQQWPCRCPEPEGPGTQGQGDQSLASLPGYGCVIWSLKSHPCEITTNCSPEHLPKIALTSGCDKIDSWLWHCEEHLTLIRQPSAFCVARTSRGGGNWQWRMSLSPWNSHSAGFRAVLPPLLSETSLNPAHTGTPQACSVRDGSGNKTSFLQSLSLVLTIRGSS